MSMTSVLFYVFVSGVVLAHIIAMQNRAMRVLLLLSVSYFFYMQFEWRFAGLLALITTTDYISARSLERTGRTALRRLALGTSILINIGILALFKYYNFFADSFAGLTRSMGLETSPPVLALALPVGISFFTFRSLSYTIDVYRQSLAAERNFLDYALYVSFFPQLLSGPISRAGHFLAQIKGRPLVDRDAVSAGLWQIVRGLIKKVAIADVLGLLVVDRVFATPGDFSSWDLLLALYGYTFQIYYDFSGYSDIAIGIGRLLGIEIPANFNRPYLSENIRDFWNRWHITLSTWFRDYVYLPLINALLRRIGRLQLETVDQEMRIGYPLATLATMLLCGLWHGAALNYIAWGGWHGLLLSLSVLTVKRRAKKTAWARLQRRFVCFHLVVLGWLLFRATSSDLLVGYLNGLASFTFGTALTPAYYAVLVGAAVVHFAPAVYAERALNWARLRPALLQGGVIAALFWTLIGLGIGSPTFIYFQF
jgi:D-alanyl-lipoteichoic acid acyltransferase DltB (MBOAT superfamily)